jgi:hypothetical protein
VTLLRLVAIAAVALLSSISTVDLAQAQTPGSQQQARDRAVTQDRDRVERELRPGERRAADRRGRQPTPEQIAQSAQAAATAAGLSCRVNGSALLGVTNDNSNLYEVACEGGAGYIVTSATPPQTFDCLVLAAQADQTRAAGGEVAANSVCNLPGNQNIAGMVAGYAREAGVSCQVDAGAALGATPEGNLVYEVGCAGADGYHIEKTAQGWNKTDCLQIMGTNMTCRFTTTEEQAAGFRPLLAGTAIDDCDARQIRLLAQNDTGRFIEVKCASGDGYVAQVKDNTVNQVYPCARAARIGSGCTLTTAPAPAAATGGRP